MERTRIAQLYANAEHFAEGELTRSLHPYIGAGEMR